MGCLGLVFEKHIVVLADLREVYTLSRESGTKYSASRANDDGMQDTECLIQEVLFSGDGSVGSDSK